MRLRLAVFLCLVGCGNVGVVSSLDGGDDAQTDSSLTDAALTWPDANVVDTGPIPPDVGAAPMADCIDGGSVCPPRDPACDGDDWEVDYKPAACVAGQCTYTLSFIYCQPPESVCLLRVDGGGLCYYKGT